LFSTSLVEKQKKQKTPRILSELASALRLNDVYPLEQTVNQLCGQTHRNGSADKVVSHAYPLLHLEGIAHLVNPRGFNTFCIFIDYQYYDLKMNWICLRTQQMKGAVALILTIAAAFSCMV